MATKVYTAFETGITFKAASGTVLLNTNNLAAATGIVSNVLDRGSGSFAARYLMRCRFEKGVASNVGEVIMVYVFTSDNTDHDGNVTANSALTANQAISAYLSLPVVVNTASTNTLIEESFLVEIPSRYLLIGVMNSVTGLLRATDTASFITLIPLADELQ